MNSVLISVIIPVYNRRELVCRSVNSAIKTLNLSGQPFEIIVVDDGSIDGSAEQLIKTFQGEYDLGVLKVTRTVKNGGVSRARNLGVSMAKGYWLMFLDSDDILFEDASKSIIDALAMFSNSPVVFFRCQDQNGKFVGVPISIAKMLDTQTYINVWTMGEALPVVRSNVVNGLLFDESLVGYEGLSFLRIIEQHGAGVLTPIIARLYDQSGIHRLSTWKGVMSRADTLARGHLQLASEFRHSMTAYSATKWRIKAVAYWLLWSIYKTARMIRWFP